MRRQSDDFNDKQACQNEGCKVSGFSENECDERKFLHDLASPVGAAIFIGDSLLESMQSRSPTAHIDDLEQMKEMCTVLDKLRTSLNNRREVLMIRAGPSSKKAP